MNNQFQRLYEPLKRLLTHCDAFASKERLRAVFVDDRISEWRSWLPQTLSRERRVVETISLLYRQYNISQKNALVLLLHVLSERVDPDNVLYDKLLKMANAVERALRTDSLHAFSGVIARMDFEPQMLYVPLAGEVIAGTGDVAMTFINELTPGELYGLDVVGTSMEYEGIFAGDRVVMRAFNAFEWPSEGDLIVTKYLPLGAEPEIATDLPEGELMGPTLKVFHQKPDGAFHLGWRKDNTTWETMSWRGLSVAGNNQQIVTRFIQPMGKVIDVKRQRWWDFSPSADSTIIGDEQ